MLPIPGRQVGPSMTVAWVSVNPGLGFVRRYAALMLLKLAYNFRMDEMKLLERITFNPEIFGGKPTIRGRRLAVEHILSMLAAGDAPETILSGYPWLEYEDVQACLLYARKVVGSERIETLNIGPSN